MSADPIPQGHRLALRWRLERVARLSRAVLLGVCAGSAACILLMLAVPGGLAARISLWGLAGIWLSAAASLAVRYMRRPPREILAKRADHVLGLSDDLLSLAELESSGERGPWFTAAERAARRRLEEAHWPSAWTIRVPRPTLFAAAAALLLSAAAAGFAWHLRGLENARLAQEDAAREQRAAAADEVLKDWQDFVELTEDTELKKLFAGADQLREAVNDNDPTAAMLEMNRMEERMNAVQASIENDSLASQAAGMAEALEAFEGMGAMSAALRNQNFPAAAEEAEKLAAKLSRASGEESALRRAAAVSEMLASEAQTAAGRGNKSLSDALSEMAQAAAQCKNPGSVPNSQLASPAKSLQDQFAQESARKSRGRAVALSKEQLEMLRRKLRGDKDCDLMPSLCKSCSGSNPGGKKAGTAPGGDPRGEETALAEAGLQESASGMIGDGESETRTTSSASGSAGPTGASREAAFADYAELSRQAVEDESLPLAHRRVIRTYFERIRPAAENFQP